MVIFQPNKIKGQFYYGKYVHGLFHYHTPQGSVLGPVLFLIYINDIITNIQSEIRLFADNMFLYKTIKTSDDHQILQNDLQNGQLTG